MAPPAPPLPLPPGEVHIWRASLAVDSGGLRELTGLLSVDELERAGRFVFARDRNHFVAARGYLRQILAAYLAAPPPALRFAYSAYGKPALEQPADGRWLSFNLAHSGELALYAIARDRAVGVDVEHVRHELAYTDLISDIFSPHEQAELAGLSVANARLAFFHGWARKEAYLKARGEGLSHPPNSFEVSLLPGKPAALPLPAATAGADWSLHAIDLGPSYTAAVVINSQVAALRCFEHIRGSSCG